MMTTLMLQGCLSRKRVLPDDQRLLPAQTLTRADLLKRLDDQSKAIEKMTAVVTLDASGGALKTGVLTEYRQTRGAIVVERPNHIRVKAQAPLALATVFDMVSDGREYRAWIPFYNKFAVGDPNAPAASEKVLSNLRPSHIMDALFIDTTRYMTNPQVHAVLEETTQGQRSYYVMHFVSTASADAQLLEKIWIDRSSLAVARKQMFKADGKVETDVQYSQYQLNGNIPFPMVIDIQRPIEDYGLKITFDPQKPPVLNGILVENAFLLEQPDGAELIQLR